MQAATLADKRLVVGVDCWEADSMYPSGHYVKTLGLIGDKETETEVRFVLAWAASCYFARLLSLCQPFPRFYEAK